MTPANLPEIVDQWLVKNHPHLCVDVDNITLVEDRGKMSKAYGIKFFAKVQNEGIQTSDYWDNEHVDIYAADPDFFKKLDEYLRKA